MCFQKPEICHKAESERLLTGCWSGPLRWTHERDPTKWVSYFKVDMDKPTVV